MHTQDDEIWQEKVSNFCRVAAAYILKGATFAELRARLMPHTGVLLDHIGMPPEARAPGLVEAMATGLGMEIWNATPMPDNRFRPRKLAKPERNAPCPCGSGRKYKQCCAEMPPFDLGVTEEIMLAEVLDLLPKKTLAELPLTDLHPDALARVAQRWLDEGHEKPAVALLERLFKDIDKLDSRAELAADTLLNAYLDINAPRKKTRFIAALQAAPDKTLRSCGWQRLATMCSDRGDYPGAWEAFREAQRITPNAPALSHLEVLLLLSEGRESEARARAKFWITRLGQDAKHDYGDLIELLRDMTSGDAGKLRTAQFARGPLRELADAMANWPAPACEYRLAGGDELEAKPALHDLEMLWMDLREAGNLDHLALFAAGKPLAGQSFMILRDLSEFTPMLAGGLPGSGDALSRQILLRGETLRQTVLGKLKAAQKELPWGCLNNRPMLSLVACYIDAFAETRPAECLALMRWSVTQANPGDNAGLRGRLIHMLIALGTPREAIDIAAAYPDDFAETEYGRALACFAAGEAEAARAALQKAVERWPKTWKMLHAVNPKQPGSRHQGYITVGGDDEAWIYRDSHRALWQSTGALAWSAGITFDAPRKKAAVKKSAAKAGDRQASDAPEIADPDAQSNLF